MNNKSVIFSSDLFKLKWWYIFRLSSIWLLMQMLIDFLIIFFLNRAWIYMWISLISSWSINIIRFALLLQNAYFFLFFDNFFNLYKIEAENYLRMFVQYLNFNIWLQKSHHDTKDLPSSKSSKNKKSRYK